MMAIYTQRLPSATWREIAHNTTNGEFRAQIMAEVDEHSPNDELRIRIDHILEGVSPQPSPDRAALVERMAEAMVIETSVEFGFCRHVARIALAAVEAAGWGPRPEPITEAEIQAIYRAAVTASQGAKSIEAIVARVHEAVLAALPERHRRLVLGVTEHE